MLYVILETCFFQSVLFTPVLSNPSALCPPGPWGWGSSLLNWPKEVSGWVGVGVRGRRAGRLMCSLEGGGVGSTLQSGIRDPPPPPNSPLARLGAVAEHPESSQQLGLCPAAEGHRQPAGTLSPLPGAGAVRRELRLEQALPVGKARARLGPRGPRAGHSWAGLSVEWTRGPGVGSVDAAVPCDDWQPRRTSGWNEPGPKAKEWGTERPWSGWESRASAGTLCSIESSPHQVSSRPCALWLCCLAISRPLWFVFRVDQERLHVCGMCGAGVGLVAWGG